MPYATELALFGSKSHLRPVRILEEQAGSRICRFTALSARERVSFKLERGSMNMRTSSLVRGVARMDSERKIELPQNLRRAMGLNEKGLVELRLTGASRARKITIPKQPELLLDR